VNLIFFALVFLSLQKPVEEC